MGKIAKAHLQTVVGKATSLRTYDGVYFLLCRSSKRLFGVSWHARSAPSLTSHSENPKTLRRASEKTGKMTLIDVNFSLTPSKSVKPLHL